MTVFLPPKELRFMGEDDDAFISIGDALLSDALRHVNPETVLDIGCGYGRLAYALKRRGFLGRYFGLDVLPRHIKWLQDNFGDPTYRFELANVRNGRYNPKGKLETSEVVFRPGFSPDLSLFVSVFTHMYESDIEAYLRKVREISSPKSVVYATFFLEGGDQARRPYRFDHRLNDHCSYHDPSDPLHAIAYDEAWLRDFFDRCGFACHDLSYRYQDVAVLTGKLPVGD